MLLSPAGALTGASVGFPKILYPQAGNGRLWGNDRRTKDDVGKAKLFERKLCWLR